MRKTVALIGALLITDPASAVERLIIHWKDQPVNGQTNPLTTSESQHRVRELSARTGTPARPIHRLADGAQLVTIPGKAEQNALLLQLRQDNRVASVEIDTRMKPATERRMQIRSFLPQLLTTTRPSPSDNLLAAANDEWIGDQWYLDHYSYSTRAASRFVETWSSGLKGNGIIVAVLDSGAIDHEEMGDYSPSLDASNDGTQWAGRGYDFISDCWTAGECSWPLSASRTPRSGALDKGNAVSASEAILSDGECPETDSNWHGLMVSSVLAARVNNGLAIAGAANGARIMPVRVLGKCGGYTSDIAEAIRWAAGAHPTISNTKPARVINLSLGSVESCSNTLQSAIDAARAAGAVVIVSAGNEGLNVSNVSPANCTGVISVGASTGSGSLASYSNFHPSITAPGGDDTLTTLIDPIVVAGNDGVDTVGQDAYYDLIGTSFAAPLVSAATAIALERNPNLTEATLRNQLLASARTDNHCPSLQCGAGLLDSYALASSVLNPAASASNLSFNGQTEIRYITISNNNIPMRFSGLSLTGATGNFSLVQNTCTSAATNCTVGLKYTPTTSARFATLTMTPQGGGIITPLSINLSGPAKSPLLVTGADLSNKTNLPAGHTLMTTLTVTNISLSPVTLSNLTFSAQNFISVTQNGCPNLTVLASNTSCQIEISIRRNDIGPLDSTMTIATTNGSDTPYVFRLGGNTVANTDVSGSGGGGGAFSPWLMLLLVGGLINLRRK